MDKARSERLRGRLREFWSGYDGYLDNPAQGDAGEGSLRVRAASFVPEGSRILDVACGLGTNSVCLAARGEYFGTDISLNFLRHAPRRDLRLACSDGEALPFAAESFDAVISTYALGALRRTGARFAGNAAGSAARRADYFAGAGLGFSFLVSECVAVAGEEFSMAAWLCGAAGCRAGAGDVSRGFAVDDY